MENSYTSIGKVTLNRKLGKLLDELKADMAKKPSIAGAIQDIISGLERMKSGKEEPKTVQLAKKRLNQAKANILGCVLNRVKVDRGYDEFCRIGSQKTVRRTNPRRSAVGQFFQFPVCSLLWSASYRLLRYSLALMPVVFLKIRAKCAGSA